MNKIAVVFALSILVWVFERSAEGQPLQVSSQQPSECEGSPLLEKGRRERDAFEQLRRISPRILPNGLTLINGEVWPHNQAEVHYEAAIVIFQQVAGESGQYSACGYRELLRLLLYNRYHRNYDRIPRTKKTMGEALFWSLSYRNKHPDDPWAWLSRGLVLYLDGKLEESSSQFERSKSLQSAEAKLFASDLPVDLKDPFVSTTINEAETAIWARAVYADMFYPGWRASEGGEQLSPGRYIVSFGIPKKLEFRVVPYNDPKEGPVSEKLYFLSSEDLVSFEDPWRSNDWYVTREKEIELGDRFRVDQFEYLDPRVQISIFGSMARFREPNGSTLLVNTFGLPFPGSTPDGRIVGGLRLATVAVDGNGVQQETSISEKMEISTSDMWRVDTLRIWSSTQKLIMPSSTQQVVTETFSGSWFSKETKVLEPISISGLAVSDVLVAHAVLEGEYPLSGPVIRNGFTITPMARSLLSSDHPTRIYFELYGLTLDASGSGSCEIQIDVESTSTVGFLRRLFGSRSRNVGVRINWTTNSPNDGLYLDIEAEKLPPGPATLTATIIDSATGEQVSSILSVEVK